jgi:2-dehydro-3-deoxy-D-arabinonate dehydratase
MRIVRYLVNGQPAPAVGVELDDGVRKLDVSTVGDLLARPLAEIRALVEDACAGAVVRRDVRLLPPVDSRTEVWAAGVTYQRSRQARVEESVTADVYDRVYDSLRPELFFKCAAWRAVTDGEPVGIRPDSALNVPEPELALVANQYAEIVGYLVCNDMTSRSIEAANPLYLPQAKTYAGSCALSDGIRPAWEIPSPDALDIVMTVEHHGTVRWEGESNTRQIRRAFTELTSFLFEAQHFPEGVVLTTGTGIVPELAFTLQEGDLVTVRVQDVGTLANTVAVGLDSFSWLTGSSAGSRAGQL